MKFASFITVSIAAVIGVQTSVKAAIIKGSFDLTNPSNGYAKLTIKKDDAQPDDPFVSGMIEFNIIGQSDFEGKYTITEATFLPNDWTLIGIEFDFNGETGDLIFNENGDVIGKFNESQNIDGNNFTTKHVPEPLTILGSATALGFGALLKRESSKKKNS